MNSFVMVISILALAFSAVAADAKTAFSLRDWSAKDESFKLRLVAEIVKVAKEDGVTIRLGAAYYVKELDALVHNSIANGDEAGLDGPLMVSFKTIAVMDCDWDNGESRLAYATQLMGDAVINDYKSMYPEKYKKLEAGCK